MVKYTFSITDLYSYKTYYPITGKSGPGGLDFDWTDDITKAITWPSRDSVEEIAKIYYMNEIIEINENGDYYPAEELK